MNTFAALALAAMPALAGAIGIAGLAGPAAAATLEVRGRLVNAQGQPESGSCLLRFKLFDVAPGSPEVWSDSQYVSLNGGEFLAVLGMGRAVPPRLLTDGYRLGIEAPAGTGWKATATSVAATPETEPPRPAPRAAAATKAPERRPLTAEARAVPAQPREEAGGEAYSTVAAREVRPSAAAQPAAVAREELANVSSVREERASPPDAEETARLRARLEALEKKVQPGPREFRAKIYEVQPGDTLQSVAAKIWGDPTRWAELYKANADRVQRGGDIRPGQRLVVPEVAR